MTTDQPTPTVGSRIRVTRTHVSGDVITGEGVVTEVFQPADRSPIVHMESGAVWVLADLDGWQVTWEEIEPAPVVLPEEPPGGSLVLDKDGDVWRRSGGRWKCLNEDIRGRDWRLLLDEFGPVTRLVPATDVVDAGIVRRLADALRTHALAKHIDHKASFGEARFDDCTAPSCREISALLVLAEGATGGGR